MLNTLLLLPLNALATSAIENATALPLNCKPVVFVGDVETADRLKLLIVKAKDSLSIFFEQAINNMVYIAIA